MMMATKPRKGGDAMAVLKNYQAVTPRKGNEHDCL